MKVYALKNIKENESASGGAFITIAKYLFEVHKDALAIYGAVFNDSLQVVHMRITSMKELYRFQGSKYVQSKLADSYKKVAEDLNNGVSVLFSGTPCQIVGLIGYLGCNGVNRENLYTVDIICHGTPDHLIWDAFKAWLEEKYGSKLEKFSFRYSLAKWKRYPTYAKFINGKETVNAYEISLYTDMFLKKLMMRNSCYNCRYSNLQRVSDITIGDFWGISKVMPQFGYFSNVSEVLVNTDKGSSLFELIILAKNADLVIEQCLTNDFLKYQHNLTAVTEKPVCADSFQKDFKLYGMDYVLRKYANYSMKSKLHFMFTRFYHEYVIRK